MQTHFYITKSFILPIYQYIDFWSLFSLFSSSFVLSKKRRKKTEKKIAFMFQQIESYQAITIFIELLATSFLMTIFLFCTCVYLWCIRKEANKFKNYYCFFYCHLPHPWWYNKKFFPSLFHLCFLLSKVIVL